MAPGEAHELSRAKYTKLDAGADEDPASPRHSLASNLSLDDLDELDPLTHDATKPERNANDSAFRAHTGSLGKASQAMVDRARRQRWSHTKFCCALVLLFVTTTLLLLSVGGIWAWKTTQGYGKSPPVYPAPKGGTDSAWASSYIKAAALVREMTLVEKVNITTGIGWSMGMCVGNTGPVPRLKFPSLCLQDGPLGLRFADRITAFPAGITVGATWNKNLMYERGRALGREAKLKGVHVLLGPAMGPFGRMPAGGRNWEGFGPDPVIQGVASAETIRGIQDEGVQATAKHYVANEQEHFRRAWEWMTPDGISSNIDDRTLHELYAWPFAESVRAGVASVMCSYNRVNNSYACQNSKLMNGVLKDELGFQGYVQSDWQAQMSGVASALAGMDMAMPGDGLKWSDGQSLWGAELTRAVLNESLPVDRLDDMVTRIVAAWYQLRQDNTDQWPLPPPDGEGGPNFSSWTDERVGLLHPGSDDKSTGVVNKFVNAQGEGKKFHGNLVRRLGAEGTVLVKNEDDVLPLVPDGWTDKERVDKDMKFRVGIFGEDARANPDGPNACPDRSCNVGTLASGWGSGAVDFPYLVTPLAALRNAFHNDTVYVVDWPSNELPARHHKLLEDQDLCIVFANADAGEGYLKAGGINGDRNDLRLQKRSETLIQSVATGCGKGAGKTIVVIHAVGPVILEPFIDLPGVKAVLLAHLPGQESGHSLVDVLFGHVSPSGRLPYTIAKGEADYGPGSKVIYRPNGLAPQQDFSEGLYVDYRHLDKHGIEPRYEFGFGLGYSQFELSALSITSLGDKTPFPAPRTPAALEPPSYPTQLPDPKSALYPAGFRKLRQYVYPYLDSVDIKKDAPPSFPSYDPSPAGGGQGGNPDLYRLLVRVAAELSNTGHKDSATVVQLYVSFPADYRGPDGSDAMPVDFPVRVLRGFQKLDVEKGGRQTVEFQLSRKDLSYWDTKRQNWVLPTEGGVFSFQVGFSSRDLPLAGSW